ncbi:MAG: hypothetical protein JSS11_05715 [Verrucomicrobia bacterium]|nr:hypothetical protein [Verrucomicrobiota bacterium]
MPAQIFFGSKVVPRIKFTWGRRPLEQARWRFGLFTFYSSTKGFPRSGFAINVAGLLSWTLGLGAAGYLALALAFTQWFRSQPHNQIGFTDVLTWPVRRTHMAQLRGRAWLAQGKEAMQARRWAEGLFYLRRGLDVCPDDMVARFMLGGFYLQTGQRVLAMELLVAGPRYAAPSQEWLEPVFQLMEAGEEWDSMLKICDLCLARTGAPFSPALRQQIVGRKAEALIALARPGEALALTEAEGEGAAPRVKTQRARALLALGRADEALAFLVRWHKEAPRADRLGIQQLHVRALREMGRLDLMEQELNAISAANPTNAAMAAFAVEQRARAGRGAPAALEDYIFRFGGTDAKLRSVVRRLAEIPAVPLVRRVADVAAKQGYPKKAYYAAEATALLRTGDWAELARIMPAMAPEFEQTDNDSRLWYGWMKGLAEELTTPPTGAQAITLDYLSKNLVSLEAHQLSVAALHRAGRLEATRDLLVVSRRLYPESRQLRDEQEVITRELTARAAAVAAVAAPKEPAAPAPLEAEDFFRQVDAAVAAKNWPAARELISGVRASRTPPPWLGGADTDLLRRELRINQALGDTPALQLAARLLLNTGPARADEVLAFARELDAGGAKDDAVLLAQAVIAKYPENDSAAGLLAAWRQRDTP